MKTFLSLGLFASMSMLPAGAATVYTVTFDESTASPATPAGLQGRLESGTLVLCDAFDTVGGSTCSGSNVSDYVFWAGGSIMGFFSDLEARQGPLPGTAETGVANLNCSFGNGCAYILEPFTVPEVITYSPTGSTQPGAIIPPAGGDTVTYTITSDGPTEPTPEPVTFVLLGGALVALGVIKQRF